jgi:hypothetical protein
MPSSRSARAPVAVPAARIWARAGGWGLRTAEVMNTARRRRTSSQLASPHTAGSHNWAALTASCSRRSTPTCRAAPGGVGLTTALTVLRSGWVIVGSLPAKGGNISGPGCLIVLNSFGQVRETFAGDGINGPWDMAAVDSGSNAVLFVSNVLLDLLHYPVSVCTPVRPLGCGKPGRQDASPSSSPTAIYLRRRCIIRKERRTLASQAARP